MFVLQDSYRSFDGRSKYSRPTWISENVQGAKVVRAVVLNINDVILKVCKLLISSNRLIMGLLELMCMKVVKRMRMQDQATAIIDWELTGSINMLPLDVRCKSSIQLNLLTGQIKKHM